MTNYPDSLEIKVWITLPGEEPHPAEVPAEEKRITECVVEEGSYKY